MPERGQALKVMLPPLPLCLGVGQRAIKQADQLIGLRLGCRKHAYVKLVVSDNVQGRIDKHEPARRTYLQGPPLGGGRPNAELAYLGQTDHCCVLAG
jgi:hypothetical protein